MSTTAPASKLLRLDRRDVAGLVWLKERAAFWRYVLRKRRKYGVQRGANFSPEEAAAFKAVMELEKAVEKLLEMAREEHRHSRR